MEQPNRNYVLIHFILYKECWVDLCCVWIHSQIILFLCVKWVVGARQDFVNLLHKGLFTLMLQVISLALDWVWNPIQRDSLAIPLASYHRVWIDDNVNHYCNSYSSRMQLIACPWCRLVWIDPNSISFTISFCAKHPLPRWYYLTPQYYTCNSINWQCLASKLNKTMVLTQTRWNHGYNSDEIKPWF